MFYESKLLQTVDNEETAFFFKKKKVSFGNFHNFNDFNNQIQDFVFFNFYKSGYLSKLNVNFNLTPAVFLIFSVFFFIFLKKLCFFKKIKQTFVFKFINLQDSTPFFFFFSFFLSFVFLNFLTTNSQTLVLSFFTVIIASVSLTPLFYILNFKLSTLVTINSTKKKSKLEVI